MALHSSLTGTELHEPKGIASATANQLYLSDGATSGTWTDATAIATANEYAVIYTADGSTASGAITTAVELAIETNFSENVAQSDAANNRLILTTAGIYLVSFNVSYTGSASNAVWQFHARLNGAETYLGIHRKIGTGADVGACGFTGILVAGAGNFLTVYAESDTSSTITIADAQLTAVLLQAS